MAEAVSIPQRGASFLRALIVAGALVLSGCQTMVPRGPASTAPVKRPAPTQNQGLPTIPVDVARHRVALLVPLSGSNAGIGQSLANATQLALLDTKSERVRITTYDTNGGAAQAAQRALADGNRLILGPLLAEDVRVVTPIARQAGVPVVSFSNDTSVAGNGAWLMGYSPAQSIQRVVAYAHDHGVTDFAGLMPVSAYGQRASTMFLRAVEGVGGQVRSLQTYGRAPGDLAAAAARMKASAYQAVLIADSSGVASLAVPAIRKNGGATARVLGTDQWNLETGTAAKPALAGAWFASVSDTLYRQYAAKYRARFGAAPYRMSSLGYDSVLLTVRIARDWQIGAPFPEARLRDAGGFAGIDGAFRFGRDSVAERALEVQEIRAGATVVASPAPSGFGDR
jgi:ABC-type branched-subunit amino acid transport system substrate-binding protein